MSEDLKGPVISARSPWPTDVPLEAAVLLGSLFVGTHIGFAFVDCDGRYVAANELYAAWIGVPAAALAGRRAGDDGLTAIAQRLDEITGAVRPLIDVDERLQPAGSPARELRVVYMPIAGARNQVLGVAVIARDVTAERAVQLELQEVSALQRRESSLLRSVVEQVPVGIAVIWGREHRYLLVNERARQMLPPRGEMVGRTLDEVFGEQPEVVALARGLSEQVFETKEVLRLEELPVPFGDPESFEDNRYYDVSLTPIFDNADVAGLLAVYVEVTDQVRRRRGVESELAREREVALILQQSLLPASLPAADDARFASAYRPGRSGDLVGGDFFDVRRWRGRWLMILGDVQGKGVKAATTTTLIRYALRAALLHRDTLAGLLADLNRVLLDDASSDERCLCTVVLAALDTCGTPAELKVALAGHPRPVLVSATGEVDDAFTEGTMLGVTTAPRFHEDTRSMAPGDALVLYSDGVPDAQAPQEWIDVAATLRAAARAPFDAESLIAALRDRAMAAGPPRDDLALLAIQPLPVPAAAPLRAPR